MITSKSFMRGHHKRERDRISNPRASALLWGKTSSSVVKMGHTSSLVFAGIAPHPPIMVPEVGGDAIGEVRASIDAMATLTKRIIESKAETLVLISPHAPLE